MQSAWFPHLPWNLQNHELYLFLFDVGEVPGLLFKNRVNLEFVLKFNIWQNLEFNIFNISYGPNVLVSILTG